MPKKWTSYILLFAFAAFIWGYSLFDAVIPAREYSEMENRYLTQMPKFSWRALMANNYTLKIEEFTNDQFLLRDNWITLKSLCETGLLKIENNGIVYGRDHYLFEKRTSIDEDQLEKNINSLLAFSQKFPEENITLALVPTSDAVLTEKYPQGLPNIDQLSYIRGIYERAITAGINTCDLASILISNRDEYLYYRTDHHWTTRGAYLAYSALMEDAGIAAVPFESLSGTVVPDFFGTFYSKAKLFSAVPDSITWYDIPVKSVTVNGGEKNGLYDLEMLQKRDKYAMFLHSNNDVTAIQSDCSLNHEDGKTSRVLLFKDSFGNSLAPFLCYGFDEVTVVDLRYFNEVEQLIRENDFDEIIVLYSFPTFAQESSVVKFKL